MLARPYVAAGFVASITLAWVSTTHGQEPQLDPVTIKAALKTTVIEDDNYVLFLVTLVDQGRLPRVAFDTAFRWARHKTYLQFQFFKRAAIAQADRMGVVLPMETPPLRESIRGKVLQRVLLVDVPVPYIDVQLVGTTHKTKTNIKGEFTFADLGWRAYTVEADGSAIQLFKKVTAQVKLPYLPNDTTTLTLRFR
jgi:hypothetical protein